MKTLKLFKLNENVLKLKVTHSILEIVVSKEDDTYCSLSLDYNVASEGNTIDEAVDNLLEALKDYIELAIENKIELYRPVPIEDNPFFVDKDSIVSFLKIAVNIDLEYLDKQLYV